MEKLGQFLANDSCLWLQEIDCARESLQELDYGVRTFDDTTVRAVVLEQLKALRLTGGPAQRLYRPLEEGSPSAFKGSVWLHT